MKSHFAFASLCILLSLGATGCNTTNPKPQETPEQTQLRTQLEQQEKAAAQTAQAYKAMDNATLINKLAEQSARQREPFNSLAYRELVTRKDVDSKALLALVNEKKNADAVLPLLLLRKLDEKTYLQLPAEVRASVLLDALERSKTFNLWGMPNFYLEDAAKALLECGKTASPRLRQMLSDTRPAPVYGSKAYMVYKHFQFRLCDYALYFLKKIEGDANFTLPASVSDRDTLIKSAMK